MAVVSALAAGAMLGVRHALEADHLAAVTTLVEDDSKSGLVGAWWGVGHSVPIVVLGLVFVALGVRVPEAVTTLFEVAVGVVLVVLGARTLWTVLRGVDATRHDHGGGSHAHLSFGDASLGLTHQHLDGDSFLVGVLHGFAGSGALVVALVSTAPTVETALSFLAAFSLLSVVTMAAVSALWGRTLGTGLATHLRGLAGLLGVCVGVLLLSEQLLGVAVL